MIAGVAGWVLFFVMTSMYLGKRDDYSAEIERCRADKLESLLLADQVTRRAAERAAAAHLAELDKMAENLAAAERKVNEERLLNQEAALRFESLVEELADDEPESCLNSFVDDSIVRGLRAGTDRRPPGASRSRPD